MSEEEIDKYSLLEQYKSEYLNRHNNAPEHYFENFESRLLNRMNSEKKVSNRNFSVFKNPKTSRYLAIAASFLILIFAGIYTFTSVSDNSNQALTSTDLKKEIEQLNENEVQAFLENEKSVHQVEIFNQNPENINSIQNSEISSISSIDISELENLDEEEEEILDEVDMNDLSAALSEKDLTELENSIIR